MFKYHLDGFLQCVAGIGAAGTARRGGFRKDLQNRFRQLHPAGESPALDLHLQIAYNPPGHRHPLIDTGNWEDVEETRRLLEGFHIRVETVRPENSLRPFHLAVIPVAVHNTRPLKLNRDALFHWMEKEGGTLLVLEQNTRAESLIRDTALIDAPQTLVDLVHPAHPALHHFSPKAEAE